MRTAVERPAVWRISALLLCAALLSTGCGDDGGVFGSIPESGDGSAPVAECSLEDVEGCALVGVVFSDPMELDEALGFVEGFAGTALAVYRVDAVCVPDISFTAMPPDPPERVPSRFAYVDAGEIRDRRLAATNAGLSPPITGGHISESYWEQWEEEWRLAQHEGVLIAAVGFYTSLDVALTMSRDTGVVGVVEIPSRRTDSLDPSYAGELFVESKAFPAGYLDPVPSIDC